MADLLEKVIYESLNKHISSMQKSDKRLLAKSLTKEIMRFFIILRKD